VPRQATTADAAGTARACEVGTALGATPRCGYSEYVRMSTPGARHRPATDGVTSHGPGPRMREGSPDMNREQLRRAVPGIDSGTPRTRSANHTTRTERPIDAGRSHQVASCSVACHEASELAQRHCRLPRLWRPRVALAGCVTWHDPGGTLRRTKGSLFCHWAHALVSDAMVPAQV
jgi:hypothetical protein